MMNHQDLRYTKRFRLKSYLLNFLFPIRIVICVALTVLSYNHWLEISSKAEENGKEVDVSGNLIYVVLFGLVVILVTSSGWLGVIKRNWSLAVAFNATAILLLMIDLYMSIFDIPFHLIALVITILLLILNIFLSFDLDAIRKQQNMIRRARIEEADRRKKLQQLEQQQQYYKSMNLQNR